MPHEGKVGQRFVIDLDARRSISPRRRARDKLADTVSYEPIVDDRDARCSARAAIGWSRPPPARSPTRCSIAFRRFAAVRVTVHKPHAPIAAIFDDVGVIVMRARDAPRKS